MKNIAVISSPNSCAECFIPKLVPQNLFQTGDMNFNTETFQGFIQKDLKIKSFPGMHSLGTKGKNETEFMNQIKSNQFHMIINLVNAASLDRSLYLTLELVRLNIPMVIIVTNRPKARKLGRDVDLKKLEQMLGITVQAIESLKGKNLNDFIASLNSNDGFTAPKTSFQLDSSKSMYNCIDEIIKECEVSSGVTSAEVTEKLDRVLLNKHLAYPIFMGVIFLTFKLMFSWVGGPLSELLSKFIFDDMIPWISHSMMNLQPWLRSLIIDGMIPGVASVLTFVPVVLMLFIVLSFLKESGYMQRIAFLMDRVMYLGGISGKSFFPMIMGFGCSVPAILEAKSIENERERKTTAMLIPFMSCNAKLPVYMMLASIFFHGNEMTIIAFLYGTGILVAFTYSLVLKRIHFSEDFDPYLEELPPYMVPEFKVIASEAVSKAKEYVMKIFTVILWVSIIIWFLSNFNIHGYCQIEDSLLAGFGMKMSVIFKPLGFGSWENAVALITGLMGKEVVAGTLGVLYGGNLTQAIMSHFTPASALSFLVFILLYTPCLSALATLKKEFGLKTSITTAILQFSTAWLASFICFNVSRFFLR